MKDTTSEKPTQESHHMVKVGVKIADTDISVMNKFVKLLNMEDSDLSKHDKEILFLGYEKKYIDNNEDLHLKNRVSC